MRQLPGMLSMLAALAFVGCQQTQEADEEPEGTTVIEEEETVVPPAEPDVDMDVEVEPGGAAGEVEAGGERARGEVRTGEEGAAGEVEVENP